MGLRGGGGNFGVATSFEFALHPMDRWCWPRSPMAVERAREVMRFYAEFSHRA